MRCKCCDRVLGPSYNRAGEQHCGRCSREMSGGATYSQICSDMAEELKDKEAIARLERLAEKHRNNEMLNMASGLSVALRKVYEGIRPFAQRQHSKCDAKWWCSGCSSPLTKKRCIRCELKAKMQLLSGSANGSH